MNTRVSLYLGIRSKRGRSYISARMLEMRASHLNMLPSCLIQSGGSGRAHNHTRTSQPLLDTPEDTEHRHGQHPSSWAGR